jgi:4-carboxymuconolactone decarboxylase
MMTDTNDKTAAGQALAGILFAGIDNLGSALPEKLREYTFAHLFGDVWQGADLSLPERSLVTCAILVALNRTSEQHLHFIGAKNLGLPREKIEAMITHAAHYAGWPCAASAAQVLKAAWPVDA